jgi:hypothetical protein
MSQQLQIQKTRDQHFLLARLHRLDLFVQLGLFDQLDPFDRLDQFLQLDPFVQLILSDP